MAGDFNTDFDMDVATQQPLDSGSGPDWGSLASLGAGAAGSYFASGGDMFGSKANDASAKSWQAAVAALQSTQNPNLAALIPKLDKYVQSGQLTPAQAASYLQQSNAYNDIQTDPNLTQDQYDVINQLKTISDQGGMTAVDRANVEQIGNQEYQKAAGQQQANIQSAQQRGIAGSGLEQVSNEMATQAGANRAAARGTDVAQSAQQRALQALQQSGQLAGNLQGQQYQQAANKAAAANAIQQFNTGVQNQASQFNAQNANAAQAANLQNQQNIANLNTQTSQQQAMLPLQVAQQQYQNEINKNAALAKALQSQGTNQTAQAGQKQDTTGKIMQAAITYGPMIASAFSDETKKTDVSEMNTDDMDSLLDGLTGYKYKYDRNQLPISDEAASKQQYGVMAQDLEKTPLAGSVVDTDMGKVVADDPNMNNAKMAALANLHKRVKQLEGRG